MLLTKRRKVALICVLTAVLLQVLSYLALSSYRLPAIALRWTPERTHYRPGRNNAGPIFRWVLLNLQECSGLSPAQRARMASLFKRRYENVYTATTEVPAKLILSDSSGKPSGYAWGYGFQFSVIARGPFWARISHGDYEGSESASGGEHVYVWLMGFWVRVQDGHMRIS